MTSRPWPPIARRPQRADPQGTPARFLRSVFVPEDGICFLLFEAATAGMVEEAGRRAALHVGPDSEALRPAVPEQQSERRAP